MSTATKDIPAPAPAPALWGVGQYRVGEESVTFPVGKEDLDRDIASALSAASSLGMTAGTQTLVVSLLSESAQYWPFQVAVLATGARLSCADATPFDAPRVAMFLRAYDYDLVLGVNSEVLDGLAELGHDLGELFASAGVVAARPGAYERLAEAGVATRWWLPLGPTIGVECATRAGAHVDGDEWELAAPDGEVLITARRDREARIERQATGVRGTVLDDDCPCGRTGPRVVPETA